MFKQNFELFFFQTEDTIRDYISFLLENLKFSSDQYKQKNLNFSLDDSFKFHFLEDSQNNFCFFYNISDLFLTKNGAIQNEDVTNAATRKETLAMDTDATILNTVQSMPILIKNLMLGHLQTFIKHKQIVSKYENDIIQTFNTFLKNIFFYCEKFISCYTNNQSKRKKMFKDLLKRKMENILNNQYILFLTKVKHFFNEIQIFENEMNIQEKKNFSSSLETALIQSNHYLNVMKHKQRIVFVSENVKERNEEKKKNEFIESDSSFQMHQVLKSKEEIKTQNNKNLGENLLLFEQIETDLKKFSHKKNLLNLQTFDNKENKENIQKEILKDTEENLDEDKTTEQNKKMNQLLCTCSELQESFLKIKHEIFEIATKHYEEFQNLVKIDIQETIKSILQEMSPEIKILFCKLKDILHDGIQKTEILNNILKSTIKEIEEQKKINKHLSLKMDLCVKHFYNSAQENVKNDKFLFFDLLKNHYLTFIKNLENIYI